MGFTASALKGIDAARKQSGGLAGLRGLSGLGGADDPGYDEVQAADPGEGLLTTAALLPVRAAGKLLEGIGYVDATTRAAIGGALGVKGSGEETVLGSAPRGRELLGLGPGKQGTFESGDVPGFIAEAVLSPFNLLGLGTLSKTGKAAKALEEVSALEKGYAASEQAAKAAELEPRIAGMLAEHGTPGTQQTLGLRGAIPGLTTNAIRDAELADAASKLRYGQSLGEQGALGQRSLLSLDVPGLDPISLLPRSVNAAGLGALGTGYERLIGAPLRPLYDTLFRPAGKIGERGFDTLVDVTANEGTREGARVGEQQAIRTTAKLDTIKVAPKQLDDVRDYLQDAKTLFEQDYVARFGKAPKPGLLRQFTLDVGLEDGDAARKLVTLGLEHTGIDAKVAPVIADIRTQLAQRTAAIDAEIAARKAAGLPLNYLPARKAQLAKAAARRIFPLEEKARIGGELLNVLQPEVASEVSRLAAVTGRELAGDQAAGVRVSALTDPLLGYVHRAVTPAGRELADNLLKLGVQEDDGLRVVRQFTSELDFTKRRSEALRGLGVLQANDWLGENAATKAAEVLANPLANPAQRKAAQNVERLLAGGAHFFEEDPAVGMLRRIASGREARGNARLMSGVVEMFGVDKKLAGPNAVPVPKFLERAGLGQFKGAVLPSGESGIAKALQASGYDKLYIPATYHEAALKSWRVLGDPEELRGALGLWNKLNSFQRLGATLARPGYYARNALGNAWNMWLAGFRNPAHLMRAYDLLRREAQGALTASERRLLDRAIDLGAIDSGAATEIRKLTRESGVFGGDSRLARGASAAVDVGLGVNRRIENTSKLALFLDGEAKGLSATEAAERVKKYLFDYTDLSTVEKKYLRRLAFFYTFQRKNIPLQIEAIIRNPKTFRAYGLATGRIGESVQRELLPQWQANQGLIATGRDDEGQPNFISLGLPAEDVFRYSDEGGGLRRAGQKLLGNLVPSLRVPLEGISGVAFGTGLPLRGRASDLAIASTLPEPLGQDASLLLAAESGLPTAGVSGIARRLGESGGDLGALGRIATSFATGISPVKVDEAKATGQRRKELARQIKDRMDAQGVPADDPRRKTINRALRD